MVPPVFSKGTRFGFTILEIAVVLVIITIMFALVSAPLSSQIQSRRTEESKRQLEVAKGALLGFAIGSGRLPCPASANSGGRESFCAAATGTCPGAETLVAQAHGNCSNFYDGFLPAASLGLSPIDAQGYARDAWETPSNRIRYAVFSAGAGTVGGLNHPFTAQNGMQTASIPSLGAAAQTYMYVCKSAIGATTTSCGGSTNELANKAVVVLFSLGPNASSSTSGVSADEAQNLDGDGVFVSHEIVAGAQEFDDLLTWFPISILIQKMVDAQRLP